MNGLAKLVVGAAVIGVGVLLIGTRGANASPAGGRVPAGWNPPLNARRARLPSVNGSIAVDGAEWPAEAGQPPGVYTLIWDAADPATFVALFARADAPATPGVLAVGKTAASQQMLLTVPALLAALKAQGL